VIAADRPVQRPPEAKLLAIDSVGHLRHVLRDTFIDLLRPGDLVIANDAATLPASLQGIHAPSGRTIEVRLAGWRSFAGNDVSHFAAVVFGAGDYRTPTERRPLPPPLTVGDRLALGPLSATIMEVLGHPRLVLLQFDGPPDVIWAGIARHGRPIQYAHIAAPLALWHVWTVIAGPPVAFEPPSAGFALNWRALEALRARGVRFATITHAAGISSTGDDDLDRQLPLDEPYEIPATTARAIASARARGGRIVAIGTTVVRALEHAAGRDGIVRAGSGLATGRIDVTSRLSVVDAILSGTHEAGSSHYELLRAFADQATLDHADEELRTHGYRTHEFGDAIWIERTRRPRHDSRMRPCSRSHLRAAWCSGHAAATSFQKRGE
jgi:S-adenosylmethionine:tRNA ribosyltransferase-isomerase